MDELVEERCLLGSRRECIYCQNREAEGVRDKEQAEGEIVVIARHTEIGLQTIQPNTLEN